MDFDRPNLPFDLRSGYSSGDPAHASRKRFLGELRYPGLPRHEHRDRPLAALGIARDRQLFDLDDLGHDHDGDDADGNRVFHLERIIGLGLDHDLRLPKLLDSVTLDAVNAAARRTLDPSRAAVVVAGPYSR